MNIKTVRIKIYGMTCTSCEMRVKKAVKDLFGVQKAEASYIKQSLTVEYDSDVLSLDIIKQAVKNAGYSTESDNTYKIIGLGIIAFAVFFIGNSASGADISSRLNGASYLVLFLIGVLTSIHCVGMCGGIMLSQSINRENTSRLNSMKPALLYNLGRVFSYTLLGGMAGALGSVFSMSLSVKAGLQIFAGIFMVIMGLNMSGFSLFRNINLRLPWSACSLKKKPGAPFLVGLLNGLMPCGPLQTMQLYALGTGSAFKGAISMFLFSLGTLPLMLTFGALSGFLSKNSSKIILKFSGILVVVLGLIMGSRGLALSGINLPSITLGRLGSNSTSSDEVNSAAKPVIENGVQVIRMTADQNGYTPNGLYVQKNIPVKWIIEGKSLNSCNQAIVIPSLNKQINLKQGENVVEFTPGDKDISFSCWMGMIRGVIKVVDNVGSVDTSKPDSSIPAASSGMSCCTGNAPVNSAPASPSIYGSDISSVPTSRLVKKAALSEGFQTANITGKGYEFEPLITVVNRGIKVKLTIDLRNFDNPAGTYSIVNLNSSEIITTFEGKKGSVNLEFTLGKSDGYAIVKDNNILEIIEAADNLKKADLQQIREKYLD